MDNLFIEDVQEKLDTYHWDMMPSQNSICFPIIYRLYVKMRIGLKFPGIIIDKSLIIDGHHRYIASKLVNVPIDKYPGIRPSNHHLYSWKDVQLIGEDWDTPEKINFLNQQDAFYNGYSIDALNEIWK